MVGNWQAKESSLPRVLEAKNKMTQHEKGQRGEHQRECPQSRLSLGQPLGQSSILSEASQKSRGEVQAQIP